MYAHRELMKDEEFLTAALLQMCVSVFEVGSANFVEEGIVEKYSAFSVKIGGTYYLRHTHVFKILA